MICPNCNSKINTSISLTSYNNPKPGDITICSDCEILLEFNNNLELTKAKLSEIKDDDMNMAFYGWQYVKLINKINSSQMD